MAVWLPNLKHEFKSTIIMHVCHVYLNVCVYTLMYHVYNY